MGATTDTRQRMVTSAALLLRENGVAGTSIARVLEHSNGPRGSVGFHFPGGKKQLVADALAWAGGLVDGLLERALAEGTSPADVLRQICDFYVDQLVETDFRAGCPVGAVAHEAYDDAELGPAVTAVMDGWASGLARLFTTSGRPEQEAADLADLTISSVEGAILLCRIRRSTRPLELVREQLANLA